MLMNQRKMHTTRMHPKIQREKMLPRALHRPIRLPIARIAATAQTAIRSLKKRTG